MAKLKLTKRGNTWYRNGKAVKPELKNGNQVSYSTNPHEISIEPN